MKGGWIDIVFYIGVVCLFVFNYCDLDLGWFGDDMVVEMIFFGGFV